LKLPSLAGSTLRSPERVAFTPKGGCPLKQALAILLLMELVRHVAFTPKGGCPLKRLRVVIQREPTTA